MEGLYTFDRWSISAAILQQLTSGSARARHSSMYYNFRVWQTLRVTPGLEAGIASHIWTLKEVVGHMGT
jgi:hypothetical protein